MERTLPTVGFVGLGNMGIPMSKRMIDAGYKVYGYDVDEGRVQHFVSLGGRAVKLLSELANEAEVVILLLPNSKVVGDVLFSAQGLVGPQPPAQGKIVTIVDMSSSYPLDTQGYAQRLAAYGISLVDAPVSGGVKKAITGELTIMIGGDQDVVEQVWPVLEQMGTNPIHLGQVGAGHTIKALNNYLSATHLYATVEATAVIERMGIDPTLAIAAINKSTGRSGSSEFKMPTFILNQDYQSGFSLGLLTKDVMMSKRLIAHYFPADSLVSPVSALYQQAEQELGTTADHTEIDRFVRKKMEKEEI
jgi:3-hydroxyisobutyrate dehydrogenase-like beta-hydroxyacid dehydrogenase